MFGSTDAGEVLIVPLSLNFHKSQLPDWSVPETTVRLGLPSSAGGLSLQAIRFSLSLPSAQSSSSLSRPEELWFSIIGPGGSQDLSHLHLCFLNNGSGGFHH